MDTAKDLIHARLKLTGGESGGGAGVFHFPDDYDDAWFKQLTIERRVTTYDKKGQMVRKWMAPKGARNEALDVRVYAWAAYQGLVAERRLNLDVLALAYRELPFGAACSVKIDIDEVLGVGESEPAEKRPAPLQNSSQVLLLSPSARRRVRSAYV